MATITRIRKYYWVLVLLMVLGIVGFIAMGSNNNGGGSSAGNRIIGNVNGHDISWNEFQNAESTLYKGSGDYFAQRASIWNYFVEKEVIEDKAKALGLGVSNTELNILQYGQNGKFYSDIIRQRISNPQTRQVDQAKLDEIKKLLSDGQLNEEYLKYWAFQQKEIKKSRLQNKFAALVSKGAYTPKWMVEVLGENQAKKVDAAFVKIPFGNIADDKVTLSDADYSNFLSEHKATYWRKNPTRKLSYVVFDILPTSKDSSIIRNLMLEKKQKFETSENDSLTVINNGGTWNTAFLNEKQLPKNIAGNLLNEPIGTVVGPYLDGSKYSITKIFDRKVVPDSVRARHILLPVKTQADYIQATSTIDSLKNLIEDGKATFDQLAKQFGTDATKSKGGDLGYAGPNQMVKPFNDLIFFTAEKGKLYTIGTQFGLHLVEVTAKKFISNQNGVRFGTISKLIAPSDMTQANVQGIASQFSDAHHSVEEMKVAADADPSIKYYESGLVEEGDYSVPRLGGNSTTRDFVKWAFNKNRQNGDVKADILLFKSAAGFYNDKAVVAGLKTKIKAGFPNVNVMKDELKPLVMNKKKGEMLASQVTSSDLAAIASQFNITVDTSRNISFKNAFVPKMGNEPKVVGKLFRLEQSKTSAPIVGNGGVFVVQPINVVKPNLPSNLDFIKQQETRSFAGNAKNFLIKDLVKKAKIDDNRSTFY